MDFASVYSLASSGDTIFAGTGGSGVYVVLVNNGYQIGLNNRYVYALSKTAGRIFAGTKTYGLYLTSRRWKQSDTDNYK